MISPCHGTTRLERATGKPNPTYPSQPAASTPRRYAFLEFRNADAATYALNELNGHPFDAKHTFFVNRFTDIEKFANLDETYVEPQREEYRPKARLSFRFVTFF
jgi:translation initiation factor 3 subunit B